MKLRVDSVSVIVTEPEIIVSHAVNTHYCYFEFDETWGEYEKKAIFKKGAVVKEVLLEDNTCAIPWETLETRGFLKVGIYGICGDKRRPTLWSDNILISEGANEGEESKEPTPSIYEQIVDIMSETKNIAQSVRDDADAGKFDGEKGDKGDAGAIVFKPVNELPTENIDTSAIYLLPIEESEGENRFTEYVYINGKWEKLGVIGIEVDHSEYVKFTDYATISKAGVVKINEGLGIDLNSSKCLRLRWATTAQIDNKVGNAAITPSNQDYAFKVSATTNTETWTDEEKQAARDLIGAIGAKSYATNEVGGTLRGVSALGFNVDAYGRGVIVKAEKADIDAKTHEYKPIVPKMLDYAVLRALAYNALTLTDEEQAKARALIGASGSSTKLYKHFIKGGGQGCALAFLSKKDTEFTIDDIKGFFKINFDGTTLSGNTKGDNLLEMSTLFYNDSVIYGGDWIKVSQIESTGKIVTPSAAQYSINDFSDIVYEIVEDNNGL